MNEQTTNTAPADDTLTSEADVRSSMIESLRATAMLADVSIGVWSGERTDAKAMEKLKADAGATGKVGRVVKNLMAGADTKLKDTLSAFHAVRTAHVAMTQPWVLDTNADRLRGPRLLPNIMFEDYLERVTTQRRAAMQALDVMLASYDADVATAKANLGGLADAVYPTADEIKAMFYVKVDFEPLPASTDFRNLPPHFAGKLAENLRARQEKMLHNAQRHAWETIRERVRHAWERLSDPDAIFRVTTIENLVSVTELAPAWNLMGDPRVSEVCEVIKTAIGNVGVKDLRKDPVLRATVARDLFTAIAKMDDWGV